MADTKTSDSGGDHSGAVGCVLAGGDWAALLAELATDDLWVCAGHCARGLGDCEEVGGVGDCLRGSESGEADDGLRHAR